MNMIEGSLPKAVADEVGAQLQQLLADFTDLSLHGKQAHWHVTGPNFESVHLQLDQIVTDARIWSDTVAERAVSIGHPVDGNANAVVSSSSLGSFPTGYLGAPEVVAAMAERLLKVTASARSGLLRLGELDPVSQDIVIGILAVLEKHLWMIQAQLS
ncbi:MAG: Dps family protein [Candidatus Dormibacteria bacterium]